MTEYTANFCSFLWLCTDYSLGFRYCENYNKFLEVAIRDGNSWSTEDKSPLVNYILDKGRRFGIITCFLADMLASRTFERKDDLQRLFATYISFGYFTFRPWERRLFGIPSGECPEKQAVEELAESECIANGALATENCYIRYPLIIDAI